MSKANVFNKVLTLAIITETIVCFVMCILFSPWVYNSWVKSNFSNTLIYIYVGYVFVLITIYIKNYCLLANKRKAWLQQQGSKKRVFFIFNLPANKEIWRNSYTWEKINCILQIVLLVTLTLLINSHRGQAEYYYFCGHRFLDTSTSMLTATASLATALLFINQFSVFNLNIGPLKSDVFTAKASN